jgi:mannose-6-phosphate isomerase-like protein (cupin superfamily)
MPKTSKDSTDKVVDFPVALDRSSDLDGYTVNFVTIRETHDLAPMLASLPGGHCSCPHWGYITSGRMTVQFGEREEVYEAGDAFYMPPGHTPAAEAGTEFVMFSPAEQLAETEAAIMAGMQAAGNA